MDLNIPYIEKNSKNGKNITIIKEQDNFYILSNNTRIKKEIFSQYFIPAQNINISVNTPKINENYNNNDTIDVNSFFKQTSTTSLLNDLKSLDTSRISDNINDKPVVKKLQETFQSTNERQHVNNEETYTLNYTQNVNVQQPKINPSDYKVFDNDDDAYDDLMNKKEQTLSTKQEIHNEKVEIQQKETNQVVNQNIVNTQQFTNVYQSNDNNPAEQFFKTFKKNHKVKLTFNIDAMISEPDFVRMMANNLDYDIFKLYTKETLNNLLTNVKVLEDEIYQKLYNYVYNKKTPKHKDISNKNYNLEESENLESTETIIEKIVEEKVLEEKIETKPNKKVTTRKTIKKEK